MSDSTGAARHCPQKFDTALNYANDAWTSALGFLDSPGRRGPARLSRNRTAPNCPTVPRIRAAPQAPELGYGTVHGSLTRPDGPGPVQTHPGRPSRPRVSPWPPRDIVLPKAPQWSLPERSGPGAKPAGRGTSPPSRPWTCPKRRSSPHRHPELPRPHHPHLRGGTGRPIAGPDRSGQSVCNRAEPAYTSPLREVADRSF